MSDLKVYSIGADLVAAFDRKDAIYLWEGETGELYDDYDAPVVRRKGDITFTFIEHEPDKTKIPQGKRPMMLEDGTFQVTAAEQEWCDCYGRGLIASSEY